MDNLNKDQQEELDKWIDSGDFDSLFSKQEATSRMDHNFYSMLEKKKKPARAQTPIFWFLRIAIPIGLLVLAFYLGVEYSSEGQMEKGQDFASQLLTSENVNDKINLVSNTKIEEDTDQKVIDALLFSLSNDESVNVRLACINTLYDYAYLPSVRTGLIQAVSNQQSPIVLANLAQAINASGKKLSKEEFMDLINKDLPPPIKSTIDASLITI